MHDLLKESTMSSISSASGLSIAWANASTQRVQMQAKLFARVDADRSGAVDSTELQTLLTDISKKTGKTLDATQVFSTMDKDSSGSLSSEELAKGMKAVLPPPPSTMDFAQKRSGEPGEPRGPGGPGGAGRAKGAESTTAASSTDDPLDTNQDGAVSELERLAGALKDLVSTIESSKTNTGSQANDGILKLARQVYAQIASFATPGATATLDAMA
jgi:hypothetical protein